ncbi:hypothetical protein TGAM01_v202138, partial [Trichoderma gamsii]
STSIQQFPRASAEQKQASALASAKTAWPRNADVPQEPPRLWRLHFGQSRGLHQLANLGSLASVNPSMPIRSYCRPPVRNTDRSASMRLLQSPLCSSVAAWGTFGYGNQSMQPK